MLSYVEGTSRTIPVLLLKLLCGLFAGKRLNPLTFFMFEATLQSFLTLLMICLCSNMPILK